MSNKTKNKKRHNSPYCKICSPCDLCYVFCLLSVKICYVEEMKEVTVSLRFVRSYTTAVAKNVEVIKLPVYLQKYMERVKEKEAKWRLDALRKISRRGNTDVPVITSTKKELNFYLGQTYKKGVPIPLMSRYWFKAKSNGQKFTIHSWDANPSLPMKLADHESSKLLSEYITEFSQLDLSEEVLQAIQNIGYKNPTPFQSLVIPKIKQRCHVMCVAETGCGKTMSYSIPIIDDLARCKNNVVRYPNTPLALVITPGRELTEQIANAAYRVGESCGVSVRALVSGGTQHRHLVPLHTDPIDMLVASFGTVEKMLSKRIFSFSQLQQLVLDEADTLLDSSFLEETKNFLKYITVQDEPVENEPKPFGAQLILSSVTVPLNADSVLTDAANENINYEIIRSPYHHKILPHIPQKFWRVKNDNRAGILLELVKTDFQKNIPVIVFCNKAVTCDWMSKFLDENGILNAKYHAAMRYMDRTDSFNRFQTGDVNVLCCTDLASRGLDTQWAKHVINFDFPNNVSDYLFRIGRVGRVGTNQGHVTNLVVSTPGVYAVQEIEMAVRKASVLSHVDADIKKKIHKLYYRF